MSNGINLIATKNQSFLAPLLDKIKILRFIAVTLLFIVSVASVILFILIALSPLPALRTQEQTSLATISAYHTDIAKVMILQERVTSIDGIIAKRGNYTTILDALKSKLSGSTEIISLQISKKSVSVTVVSDSLSEMNSFIDGILSETGTKKVFSQATLSNLSLDTTRGQYLLVLSLTIA
jgi:hypothetical protein